MGIQTASWDFSPHTLDVIREVGLLYGNSLMGDDDPYELNDASKPTDVVELPRSGSMTILYVSICCVTRHCARTHHRPRWRRSFSQNSTFAEFDGGYDECGPFLLTTYPHVIGHRSRLSLLERLIAHTKAKGAWFGTHARVARCWGAGSSSSGWSGLPQAHGGDHGTGNTLVASGNLR